MIFHKFGRGRVGAQKKYMNIYTFWIDLDVRCPNFSKHSLVSRVPGAKIENHYPGPEGCTLTLASLAWTLSGSGLTEQKCELDAKERADG